MPPGDPVPPRPRRTEIDPPPRAEVVSVGGGREQEQSIRARKQLLFEDEELPDRTGAAGSPTKSFSEYLRATPAAPLSGSTRAILWGVGLIVVLLFIASLVKRGSSPPSQGRAAATAAAKR